MRFVRLATALVGGLLALPFLASTATADPSAEPFIIGGGRATSGPWAVNILKNGSQYCSASIIAATWVITAKHCTGSLSGMTFRIGNVDSQAGQQATPASVTKHPSADIALIKLKQSISTTYAQLPAETERLRVGDAVQPYGFGRTEAGGSSRYLKVARMTVTRSGNTVDARKSDGVTGPGDSGGPWFAGGKQVVVHSYGDAVNTSGGTSTAVYRSWIRSVAGV